MNGKKLKVLVGVLVVVAVLVFFVGPRILTWMINNSPTPKFLKAGDLKIKATGTLSVVDKHLILTSPRGLNNYVLVGAKESEMKRFVDKKQPVFVFGTLMLPESRKINTIAIRYRINVQEFDTKDFEPGQKLSTQVADSIKLKVTEKNAFRDATLKKLGIKDTRIEVVSGKLIVLQNLVYGNDPKERYGLMIMDKYGDYYLLYDWGGMKKPYEKYKKYLNLGLEVVAIGQVTLPDPSVVLPGKMNYYIPFSTKKICNPDLSEFQVDQEAGSNQ